MIRRLDHIIIAVRDRHAWADRIERVLGLQRGRGRDADEWGFANWEFDIGDGFLGVVCPDASGSVLDRFLDKQGDSFYAVSVDVGDLGTALHAFEVADVPVRVASKEGTPILLWPHPQKATAGVLFQVFDGIPPEQGGNPNLTGLRRVVLATDDIDARADQLRHTFGLAQQSTIKADPELHGETVAFDVTGSTIAQELVLAAPIDKGTALAAHLEQRGPSIFEWGLQTKDLDSELSRLMRLGVGVDLSEMNGERRALIDPAELGGLRIRLHDSSRR